MAQPSSERIETFVITYDESPKSLNAGGAGSRRHWGAAHKEKRKWEGIYGMLLLQRRVPRGMSHCRVREVLLEFRHANRRDASNYQAAIVKPFADCLVAGGWLADDTAEFFELEDVKISTFALEHPNPAVKSRITISIEATYQGGTDG